MRISNHNLNNFYIRKNRKEDIIQNIYTKIYTNNA